jgi:hypothetical protein
MVEVERMSPDEVKQLQKVAARTTKKVSSPAEKERGT